MLKENQSEQQTSCLNVSTDQSHFSQMNGSLWLPEGRKYTIKKPKGCDTTMTLSTTTCMYICMRRNN